MKTLARLLPLSLALSLGIPAVVAGQNAAAPSASQTHSNTGRTNYVLGPDDQITIQAPDIEEISKPYRVDMTGNINPPLVGRLHAAGLTVDQLEKALIERLKVLYTAPEISVSITEFRSQPVSVLGSVTTPGVYQVQGHKTLFEMLSLAGGLRADAGNRIKISRRKDRGPIPLATVSDDPTGEFSVGEVGVKSVLDGKNPADNIFVEPEDVISVPRAEVVYVVGSVRKSGGFVLGDKQTISVLQAVSLAEGLDRTAAAQHAKILRTEQGSSARTEIPVDLKKVLSGKGGDIALRADDILFVPSSMAKSAALRTFEAAIQVGTGIAIYHP